MSLPDAGIIKAVNEERPDRPGGQGLKNLLKAIMILVSH